MRAPLATFALLLATAACGTGAATTSEPRGGGALTADLVPLEASTAAFTNAKDSTARTLRVVPAPDGQSARLVLESPGGPASEIHVTRRDGSFWFSGDVDLGTELVRVGAGPGEQWESGGRRVRFDGWENMPLAAESVETARITARRGPAGLEHVETWWFARGVGLVRLRSDRGSMSVDELIRTSK